MVFLAAVYKHGKWEVVSRQVGSINNGKRSAPGLGGNVPSCQNLQIMQTFQGQMPLHSWLIEDRPVQGADGNDVGTLQSLPHLHKRGKDLEELKKKISVWASIYR